METSRGNSDRLRQNARDDPEGQYTQRDAGDTNEGVLYELGSNTCDDGKRPGNPPFLKMRFSASVFVG